ncbi:MAG: chromosomal replication initiator protein DnaA [Elusimicrobia bacterium]|nr:chromosomal replication initiator protein DnaA [Elusimicrobiota bacterium]
MKLNPQDIWSRALEALTPEIGQDNLELWLKPVEPLSLINQVLMIKVPNKFFSEWIRDHYQHKIEKIILESTGQEIALDYSIANDLGDIIHKAKKLADPIEEASPQSEFSLTELNPRYTFGTFVVGPSNRWAHATAEAVAKKPGRQYNPFFLYGGVGLGKTHLMHAIGHAMRKEHPRARVLYATTEHFVNEYINSLRNDKPDSFRNKYRNLDCLLIDDIQFLIGKGRSEEEFFYTFNALFDSRRQIVISSDRAPKEMSTSEQRLISRFEWGVVADIRPPDLETRIAILRKKAEAEQLYVPDDVILFIATAIKTNIRELEGSLIRMMAFSSLTGSSLTVDVAKEVLKDTISADTSSPVRIETIQKMVATKYSLDIRDMKSKQRTDQIAFPRQLAMYLSCVLTDLSTTDIGDAFGGRDHSTVIHARDKIKAKIEEDPFFLELVNKLTQEIKSVENT